VEAETRPNNVCATCGTAVAQRAKFCTGCGTPVPLFCQSCGANLQGTTGCCPSCGQAIASPTPRTSFVSGGSSTIGVPASKPGRQPPRVAVFGAPMATWGSRVGAGLVDWLLVGIPIAIVLVVGGLVHLPPPPPVGWSADLVVGAAGWVVHLPPPSPIGWSAQCGYFGNGWHCTNISFPANWTLLLSYLLAIVLGGPYYALLNGLRRGQTLGNRAAGIAVRDTTEGTSIGVRRGVLRWLVRLLLYGLLIIPGVLNDLWPLWDSRNQTLADKACDSVMIQVR